MGVGSGGTGTSGYRFVPLDGPGWLLVAGGAAMLLPGSEDPGSVAPGRVFLAAGSGWEALARLVVAAGALDGGSWPPFALVVTGGGPGMGAAHGVEVSAGGPVTSVDAGRLVTWTIAPGQVVILGDPSGASAPVDAAGGVHLTGGSVRARGVIVLPPTAETQSGRADRPDLHFAGPSHPPPPGSRIGVAGDGHTEDGNGPARPEPAGDPIGPGVEVDGIECGRGHFNDPRDRYCRVCGLTLHLASQVSMKGRRPPLGVLVWDTGRSDRIDGDLVVGREPGSDPLVTLGPAAGLVPAGPIADLSRVHAHIRLRGWDVILSDASSSNGTFVWNPEQGGWRRLAPGEQILLHSGMTVAFGERVAAYESGCGQP